MTYYEALNVLRDGGWFYELPPEYQSSERPEGAELIEALNRSYEAIDYIMKYGDDTIAELKPCPFDGCPVAIRHNGLHLKSANAPNGAGDFYTEWEVWCPNCGVTRGKYRTEYNFTQEGELKIKGDDGRAKAVRHWNRRADNG